jgi:hypothetical protein
MRSLIMRIHPQFLFYIPVVSNWNIGPLLGFLILFRHSAGLLWTSDQPSAKASTYRQHRKTRTNIHALSGIRTHDHIAQAIRTYASDRAATGTSPNIIREVK